MGKIYKNKNVLDAAFERLEIAFQSVDNIYFSISGVKDSSVMVQLAAMVARKLNKKFSILYIDLEAQYAATIDHIHELRETLSDGPEWFYSWCCTLSLRKGVSGNRAKLI